MGFLILLYIICFYISIMSKAPPVRCLYCYSIEIM